jgi:asparagine synthase (glutamine-hydrolysing)
MCSIVGLLNKNGGDVKASLLSMLDLTLHRGPDGCGILVGDQVSRADSITSVDTSNLYGTSGMGHLRLRITGTSGTQPLFDCQKRFSLGFNGEIWNYRELRSQLQMRGHIFETDSDSEVIIHLIEENFKKSNSLLDGVSSTIKQIDGEWAFAVVDTVTKQVVLARDPIGVKQLYYGQNENQMAFASEKKPLLGLGLVPTRVLPGNVVKTSFDSNLATNVEINQVNELEKPPVTILDEDVAVQTYKKSLFEAISKRIEGQEHIGVIFSGGVDSVLVAQIAKILGKKITCFVSGTEDSTDIIAARRAANELGLELKENIITEEKIYLELENILSAIESADHLQVDVAIPVFFAVSAAKQDGIRVMLTGQGADELFAGYPWYPKILEDEGAEVLNTSLWNDIKSLYKDTLEREDKITMYHSIELRVPYLDPSVIESAMRISEMLKIKDGWGKYVHRKVAESVGVPQYIAWRPKEAAQHGSEAHRNLSNVLLKKIHFDAEALLPKTDNESLGSAYRYNHDVYSDNDRLQTILNHIGSRIGI